MLNCYYSNMITVTTNGYHKQWYSYELLESGDAIGFVCPICIKVARKPHKCGCCGKVFCKCCLEHKMKSRSFFCPNCHENLHQNYFPDKKGMKKIRQLKIYCPNKDRECSWTGEIQQVDSHISECPREVVDCPNHCGVQIERCVLDDHLNNQCAERNVDCERCGESWKHWDTGGHVAHCPEIEVVCLNTGCKEEVKRKNMEDHQNDCLYLVVGCPNQCDSVYERHLIENHIKNECPKRLVKCKYCDDEGEYAVIAGRHLAEECNGVPLPCPNEGCEEKFKRPLR